MIGLSRTRSSAIAAAAGLALAACANQSGMTPSSSTAHYESEISRALTTCATSPPQYEWIFKGACHEFRLVPSGAHFALTEYQGISVKGLIGGNDVPQSAEMAVVDALDKNGDIEKYKGMALPRYKARGTTYVYTALINQSARAIKSRPVTGKPFFRYVLTSAKGFGSYTTCSLAILEFPRGESPRWLTTPFEGDIKGTTIRISVYLVPRGFEFPPKVPIYLAINCFE